MKVLGDKKFIIVGDVPMFGYEEIFPRIKNGEIKVGFTPISKFKNPAGEIIKYGLLT